MNIFGALDLRNIYDQKQLCNLEVVPEKRRLKCEGVWRQITLTKGKLRTYMQFKKKYDTEEYLNFYMTKYQRSLLAQFRAGVLLLRLKMGRFHVKSDVKIGCFRHL